MSHHAFFHRPLSESDPAGTTRGFRIDEFCRIGALILEVLHGLRERPEGDPALEQRVRAEVSQLCKRFPIY